MRPPPPPHEPQATLLSAPLELSGDWGHMVPGSAGQVIELMRLSCLDDVRLLSDRQPTRLRVEEHASGPPAIWLHPDRDATAWVIVDIGERAWCQLAYQFGHELGHVLANSWQADSKPDTPCRWLEEAIVEAFSLRGLGLLATRWRRTPPFAGDNLYGAAILEYRQQTVQQYQKLALEQGGTENLGAWFAAHRARLEAFHGLSPFAQAASPVILAQYERAPNCVEGIGALNRWPDRPNVPIDEYLRLWKASCGEIGASDALPVYLTQALLGA